jgi:hypothetical protein
MVERIESCALIAFLFMLAGSCKSKQAETEGASAPAAVQTPVTVTHISRDPMTDYIELNASSTFLLKNIVKANANGYLQSADIKPGQFVGQGQLLFSIKTKEAQSIGDAVNKLDSSFRFSGTNNIRAGAKGFITQLNHQGGDYVQDGEQLAVISDESSFVFLMELPFELKPNAPVGKEVQVFLPDGTALTGKIISAMPSVDPVSQTQSMVIKVNSAQTIPENLIAKVRIVKTVKTTVVSLPRAAVLTDETQSDFWIMKMTDSTTAVRIPVKKGIETKDRVEILTPILSPQDEILLTGNYGLADTAKVKIIQP